MYQNNCERKDNNRIVIELQLSQRYRGAVINAVVGPIVTTLTDAAPQRRHIIYHIFNNTLSNIPIEDNVSQFLIAVDDNKPKYPKLEYTIYKK
jgi:hypothetical protein